MTRTFTRQGLGIHPAWLLLPLPALVGLQLNESVTGGLLFRLFLTLALAVGLLVVGIRRPSGRGLRLLKELRAQMTLALVTLLIPGLLATWPDQDLTGPILFFHFAGCVFLGAAAFGNEFDQRTLSSLLTQPVSRSTLFREKVGTAAVLCVISTFQAWMILVGDSRNYSFDRDELELLLAVPVLAIASGPLFSLLSRSTLAGAVFSVAVPMLVGLSGMALLEAAYRWLPLGVAFEEVSSRWFTAGAIIYLTITAVSGWRKFQTLEVRDGGAGGRSNTGLHPLSRPFDQLLAAVLPGRNAWASLVRKELRLHVVPWLLSGILVGLWILCLILRRITPEGTLHDGLNDITVISGFAGMLGFLAAVCAGAACVAEERELGTLEWQITQPASMALQWWIKVVVATGMALVTGFVLPTVLVWIGFGTERFTGHFGPLDLLPTTLAVLVGGLGFIASLYASSLSRNTMTAVANTAAVVAGIAGLIALTIYAAGSSLGNAMTARSELWRNTRVNSPAWAPTPDEITQLSIGLLVVAAVILGSLMLWLGGRNFRRGRPTLTTLRSQALGLAAAVILLVVPSFGLFGQLLLLRNQADIAQGQRQLQDYALGLLVQVSRGGTVPERIAATFRVPAAPPQVFLESLIQLEGFEGLSSFSTRLRLATNPPPAKTPTTNAPGPVRMDPTMMRRYGLLPPTNR